MLTTCGGDVTFWKLKKFWYLTDNHMIIPLLSLYIASVTTLKEMLAFCIFFFNLELCFKLRLFTRDNSWF